MYFFWTEYLGDILMFMYLYAVLRDETNSMSNIGIYDDSLITLGFQNRQLRNTIAHTLNVNFI